MTVDDARAKARQTAEAIKEKSLAEKRENKKALAALDNVSVDVLSFLSENAGRGIEDIPMFDSLPIMRVHTSQSTKNTLADGTDPTVGQLFHSGTSKAYDAVTTHLLCIKKCQLPEYGGTDLKAHYLVAGLVDEDSSPFVMYIKGLSYNKVWNLQEQLKPFVKNRQQPIPMFALKIRVYTEKEKPQDSKYAAQFVVKYEVLSLDGQPVIETDLNRLQVLKEGVEKSEAALEEIIESKGARYSDEVEQLTVTPAEYKQALDVQPTDADFASSDGEDTPF